MARDEDDLSVDDLVQQLRERVARRREQREFPAELEAQLDGHFKRIASHLPVSYEFEELERRQRALRTSGSFSPTKIRYSTRVPGGAFLHRLIGKVVARQTAGILDQLQAHADALSSYTDELMVALQHPHRHQHDDLRSRIDLLFDRIASFQRATTGVPALGALTERVAALEDEQQHRRFHPWFSNESFEEAFRGRRPEIQERYRELARRFLDADGVVIDVGCGRGEFMELLIELGVDTLGIDIDPTLVGSAQDRGLPVEFGSLVPWLERQDDDSLGGMSLIQVVEHISAMELVEFVALAYRKVKVGGRVIVETVNPQSLYVFAHSFYLDPTHLAPVHPAYLMFLFEQIGFRDLEIEWRSPCPPDDVLASPPGDSPLEKTVAANVDRLNRLLFAAQDYALVATR